MMKTQIMRKRLQLLFLIFGCVTGNAQSGSINNVSTIPNITPPTHQTFSLSRVNYNGGSDGKFHHTIPLFSIDDNSGLNISLGYRSDVKVDDIGGSLGMFWQLNFGGVVSRVVKDEADEGNNTKWYPTDVDATADLYNIRQAAAPGNVYDTEYDWFNFNISNGLSGSFYIDENLNVFSESSENVKIQVYQIGTAISTYGKKLEIKLTDSQGNEYYFGGDDQYIERTNFAAPGRDRSSITGWYLKQVINNKKEVINFAYDIENISYISSASAGFNISEVCVNNGSNVYKYSDIQKSKSLTTSHTPRIKSIVSENQKIFFEYGQFRKDLPTGTGKLLTGISLKDNNLDLIKQYNIEYYNIQNSSPAIYYNISSNETTTINRHYIKSLTNLNNVREQYSFDYYDIDKMPSRFSLNTDYYNYYNSANNSSPFPNSPEMFNFFSNIFPISIMSANKEVKPENASFGNLKKINYPTGGFSEVFYEPNYYKKKVTKYLPSASHEFVLDKHSCIEPNKTVDTFTITGNGQSLHVSSYGGMYNEDCNPDVDDRDNYQLDIIRKETGQVLNHVKTNLLSFLNYSFPTEQNVEYIIKITLEVRFTSVHLECSLAYGFEQVTSEVPQYVGGSRVSKVQEDDGKGKKYTKKYYYNLLNKINDPFPSLKNWAADKTHIEKGEYSQNCQNESPFPRFMILNIYRVYENPLYNDFNSRNTGIFYSDVTEIIDEHSAKETTYSYVDDNDPNFLKPPFYTGVAMSNYGQIFRGNVAHENRYEYKDGAFKIIEEKSFKYDFVKHFTKRSFFFRENFSYVPLPVEDQLINISYGFYDNYYGFRKQTKVETTSYANGTPLTTTTEYNYTSPSHYQLTNQKTIFPDGSSQLTNYKYAHEKPNQKLIDANIVGIPLITETKRDGKTISKTETDYPTSLPDVQTGNLLLPKSVSSLDLITGNMGTEVTYNQYDSHGNLLQYTTKSGVSTAIIWGYNNTQPIAKVEGATYAQVSGLASAIISASDIDASAGAGNDESSFLGIMKTFRGALSNYQVTTYTYDPLIGVRSITPPSGIREVYIYDTANRLKEVRDVNGDILKEYQYNYKH